MADIRINSLSTTAASTASDDFVAVDGTAQGTRKLSAYSPTFGGNLTVSGNTTLGSGNTYPIYGYSGYLQFSGSTLGRFVALGTYRPDAAAGTDDFQIQTYNGSAWSRAAVFSSTSSTILGNLTVSGGTITGGSSGMTLDSGGTNQNITLTPSGTGRVVVSNGQITLTNGNSQFLSTGNIYFDAGGGGNLLLRTGNVLLGTTTDGGQKLQVAGSVSLGLASASGILTVQSDGPNSSWKASTSGGALWNRWLTSAGVRRGYYGYASASDSTFTILNEENGSLVLGTNNATALTLDSSQAFTFAKGGSIGGAFTINPTSGDVQQNFQRSGTGKGILAAIGTAGSIVADSAVDDFVIRTTASKAFRVTVDGGSNSKLAVNSTTIVLYSLPTSSAGLPAGSVWNDGGTLKIV